MSAWPQYATLLLIFAIFFSNLVKDQNKDTLQDRVIGVSTSFAVFAIWFGLLWAGNFWAPIGVPSL